RLEQQRDFWKAEFAAEVNVLELPTDYARPSERSHRGSGKSVLLDKTVTDKLKSAGESSGATMFMTVLSIFNILLSKLSNQEDITIGTPVAGRDHADLEGIIGMFVNTLVLRNYP
ncbi:condensation domain-containing protein, partial [Fulvivirga imtechensis]|uniref:condensation domain-containing protein n=1 Tax=Fulvivirga imtechensis TaxID=881893 RepID=UPI00058B4E43